MTLLPSGKLPVRLLRKPLSCLAVDDVNVKVGPAVGDGAAAIDRVDLCARLAADPITFPPKGISAASADAVGARPMKRARLVVRARPALS